MSQFSEVLDKLEWYDRRLVMDRLTAGYNEGVDEGLARMIYALMPYDGVGPKPRWVERGNSDMQERCRRLALEARRMGQA